MLQDEEEKEREKEAEHKLTEMEDIVIGLYILQLIHVFLDSWWIQHGNWSSTNQDSRQYKIGINSIIFALALVFCLLYCFFYFLTQYHAEYAITN